MTSVSQHVEIRLRRSRLSTLSGFFCNPNPREPEPLRRLLSDFQQQPREAKPFTRLLNRNRNAGFHFLGETDDVPVGEPNTAMARSATNCFGFVRAMEPDPFLVKRNPDHPDWTVRTGRQDMEISAALAVFKHLFVVAKLGSFATPRTFHSPMGEAVCDEPIVTG